MLETWLLVFLIGLVTGFFDSVIGAGGLISVPSLMFLGLPPSTAIATDRFGSIGQTIAAVYKFWKAKKIVWKYVVPLTLIALIGSLIGASILVHIDLAILETIIGILMLVLLPLLLLKPEAGSEHIEKSKAKKIAGFVIYFLIMVFAGFFGQGTGPLIIYTLTVFLGLTMIEVLGTGIIPWFALTVASLVIFALNGIIDYRIGIVLLIGMTIGGYAGAHLAIKKGNTWIKHIFVGFVIVLAVKLLFF